MIPPEYVAKKPIELLNILTETAVAYSPKAVASCTRNNHMNDLKADEAIEQKHVDAVLVDFINTVAGRYGIDYDMYTSDLTKKEGV